MFELLVADAGDAAELRQRRRARGRDAVAKSNLRASSLWMLAY